MFARRKILTGEEVTDCYGFHYTSVTRHIVKFNAIHRQLRKQDEVFLLRQYDEVCSERGLRKS